VSPSDVARDVTDAERIAELERENAALRADNELTQTALVGLMDEVKRLNEDVGP